MPENACRVLCVTGTDTGVGKTVVTAALAARARELGIEVAAMKPIESGIDARPQGMNAAEQTDASDAAKLALATGMIDRRHEVGPIILPEPLAPFIAAERAGVDIDFALLDTAREALSRGRKVLLVEGAGGLLVPIVRDFSFAQLFKRWAGELIIVAGNRLGALNHTLLTVQAAAATGLVVRAIVLTSLSESDATIAEATNYDALVALLPHHNIHRFAWVDRVDEPSALAAAAHSAGLDSLLLAHTA